MATKTFDQVEAMKRKAVRFVDNVLDKPDRADEIEEESVADYASRKKITLVRENPNGRKATNMESNPATKAELESVLDQVEETLEDALDPKLTREELVQKVEQAYDMLAGDEEEEIDDEDGED